MKKTVFCTLFLSLTVFAHVAFAEALTGLERNLIITEGSGQVMGQNDSARIFIAVQTEGRDMKKTASENAAKTEAVIKAIEKLKIKDLKLKTSNYRVTPQKDFKASPPKITGYEVYNEIEVEMAGFDPEPLSTHVSTVFGDALEKGANHIRSVQFFIKNKYSLEKEALIQATRQAVERAQILAEAAGLKLKRIATLSTQPISQPVRSRMVGTQELKADAAAMAPPIEAGESTIHVQVSLSYEIE